MQQTRPVPVVVSRVFAQYTSQVPFADDEGPVEEFPAQRSDKSFADRVRSGRLRWSSDDLNATGVEYRIEAGDELRIAVADQRP
jgi:hypothetical protein